MERNYAGRLGKKKKEEYIDLLGMLALALAYGMVLDDCFLYRDQR